MAAFQGFGYKTVEISIAIRWLSKPKVLYPPSEPSVNSVRVEVSIAHRDRS